MGRGVDGARLSRIGRWDKTGAATERKEPSGRRNCKFARDGEESLRFHLSESLRTCRAFAISRQLPAVVVWPSVHKRCISPIIRADNVATGWSNYTCTQPHTHTHTLSGFCSDLSRSDSLTGIGVGLTRATDVANGERDEGGRDVGVRPASSPVNWPSL